MLNIRKNFLVDQKLKFLLQLYKSFSPILNLSAHTKLDLVDFGFNDELNEIDGVNCIIVHHANIPTKDKEKAPKEDSRDALKIAQQLKGGAIKGIYVPNKTEVGPREIQRLQFTITKDLTAFKNRAKAFLKKYNIQPPKEKFTNSTINL